MKDVNHRKEYDSRIEATKSKPPREPSDRQKELLVLQAKAEKAQGKERLEILEKIRRIAREEEQEGK